MGKIAFLFAGQGAQAPGMGRSLAEASPAAAQVFERLEQLRPGTKDQCFSGTPEELQQTANTQPCLFAVELAAAHALSALGVKAQGAAGFSLGEVAALAFCGAFASEEEGFRLVCARGELMQRAAEERPGSMAAVLGLEDQEVERLCAGFDQVYPVNYNCDKQLVVAGSAQQIPAFCQAAAAAGGKTKLLAVGGGFHSPFMAEASAQYAGLLAQAGLRLPALPVYANLNAQPYAGDLRATLSAQMAHPVRWKHTLRAMAEDGFDTFVEVGPGKTLTGLAKRTLPGARLFAVQDAQGLEAAAAALSEHKGE